LFQWRQFRRADEERVPMTHASRSQILALSLIGMLWFCGCGTVSRDYPEQPFFSLDRPGHRLADGMRLDEARKRWSPDYTTVPYKPLRKIAPAYFPDERARYVDEHPELPPEVKEAVLSDKLVVGMRKQDVMFLLEGRYGFAERRAINPNFGDVLHDEWVGLDPVFKDGLIWLFPPASFSDETSRFNIILLFKEGKLVAIRPRRLLHGTVQ
jgi:hypothetical protein